MNKHIKGDLIYFTFNNFDTTGLVKHCFSTRKGGVSKGCYSSMNLSFRDDLKENVIDNYKILCNAIDCNYENVVFSNQVHGNELYYADESDRGKGLLRESNIKNIDGLITDKKDVLLTTFYADCVPLFFLDIYKKVISVSHAGWRGTVNKIGEETINKMVYEFGCDKENIIAGIGPSIGKCCFEVDNPVADEFIQKLPFSIEYIKKDLDKEGKYKIDLKEINKLIMINAGLSEKNIEVSDICTKCEIDLMFSHRRMGSLRGAMAGLLQLC